jgi:GNAT superfamily N-acetyltransferase
MNEQIRLRPANEEDIPMLFNSWLKSYRNSLFAKQIVNEVYFTEYHKIIEDLLRDSIVLIACNNDDASQIYGWCCAKYIDNIFCLHYIYVKHAFRRMGIAKVMFDAFELKKDLGGVYTHHTRIMELLAPKFNLVYHPFIAFKPVNK